MATDKADLIVAVTTTGDKEAISGLDGVAKAGEKAENSTKKLDKSVADLVKDFDKQTKNAGLSTNQIKLLALADRGATPEQLRLAEASMKAADAAQKQAKATANAAKSAGATGGPFRAMRGSMQQVSWQLQDVAVQAQMGTSAFTIIGQQGPQMASIFGPGGAVLGVLVAFGAMLGGVLYNQLTGTSEALKELEDKGKDLFKTFDDLTGTLKLIAQAQAAERMADLELAVSNATENIIEANKDFRSFMHTSQGVTSVQERLTKTINEQGAILAVAQNEINLLAAATDGLTSGTEDLIDNLDEELITLGMTATELVAYKAHLAGATDEQIRTAMSISDATIRQEELTKATEDAEAITKKQAETAATYSKRLSDQATALQFTEKELIDYKAALKGGTTEQIEANVVSLQFIADKKAEAIAVKAAAKEIEQAKKDAAKAAAVKVTTQGKATSLLEEIALENKTELEQLDAHLMLKAKKLDEYLAAGFYLEDEYLLAGQQLKETYRLAEVDANKKKNDDKIKDDKAYADAKAKIENQALQSAQNIATSLHSIAEEGSKEAKILFAIQKAIAIAQIIVATEQAALVASTQTAIGGPFAWFASVAGIRAMGYASAGIVAGTAIAGGRALGGQVRGGESYLVGERGPELLTMGTSGRVTSNDALKNSGNGADVVINQTINVTTGIQSTVRAEIVALMPQISNAAKGAVADARLRGGNFSKAMAGA